MSSRIRAPRWLPSFGLRPSGLAIPVLAVTLALTTLAAPSPASAADCGKLPKGKNPSPAEIAKAMQELSGQHGVPTEIMKGIAWRESNVQQWRSDGRLVINPKDCGYGMMQLTGATARQFDVDRLKSDWRYNLEAGVKVLVQKWKRAERKGLVPANDPEARRVLENWYYAIAFYWGGQTESYLRKIYGHIENRPGVLTQLLGRPVKIGIPSEILPGFSFGDKFIARRDGVWIDAKGKARRAPVNLGTIGDPQTLAMLDVTLARAEKARGRKRWKDAVKYYAQIVETGADTEHVPLAEAALAELATDAQGKLADARAAAEAGDRALAEKLAKRVARDYRGLEEADAAKAYAAELKAGKTGA